LHHPLQGCQIFLGPSIPKREKIPNEHKLGIPNGYKIYQKALKYSKWSYNIPIFSIPRPSKIYTNKDFWYENKPSGNPDPLHHSQPFNAVTLTNLLCTAFA
jgi:hypothetical protein